MKALLVGADKLGNIPNTLSNFGVEDYIHWDGRKKKMRSLDIPSEIGMVVVFYDYIEHNITKIIKEKAKQKDIPCIFSKRSISDVAMQIERCTNCNLCKN